MSVSTRPESSDSDDSKNSDSKKPVTEIPGRSGKVESEDWHASESRILEFERAWRSGSPADPMDYSQPEERELASSYFCELLKVDLEHRLRRELKAQSEDYWMKFPGLAASKSKKLELLEFELELRGNLGQEVSYPALEPRFPRDTSLLQRALDAIQTRNTPSSDSAFGSKGGGQTPSIDSLVFPGARLNQYEIQRRIGAGAFSVVFAAQDTRLNRRVALKVLRDQVAGDSSIRLRMMREAQAVAALQHANIVPVYETGIHQGLDYVVHRLVEGRSLEAELAGTSLDTRKSVELVRALAGAMQVAHEHGVVHRDVKPANIMLEDGVPLLVDFGLAHVRDASMQITMEGDVVGTPAYMAPEQAEGKGWQGDPRSDIYSLGAVLFHMICNRLPFDGTTAQVIRQVVSKDPPAPRKLNSGIDVDLQTIVLKCLEKEPRNRYRTAGELEQDLTRYLAGQTIQARPSGLVGRTIKWSRRRPVVAGLALGVVCLLAFSLGVLTQLWQVGLERDRSQQAEKMTMELFARVSADAGRLAMSRGRYADAIEHFQSSLDRGAEFPWQLRLRMVEAHVALREIDQARVQLLAILENDRMAETPSSMLWKAELAMEGLVEFGDTEESMQQALRLGESLDPARKISGGRQAEPGLLALADRAYANGILAKTSGEAVKYFQEAVVLDPYHHRSRRMLVIMMLALAQFEDAMKEISTARQLFVEDGEFVLMEALGRAALDQPERARQLIDGVKLYSDEKKRWHELCELVRHVVHAFPIDDGMSELNTRKLADLSGEFGQQFRPLLEQHGWRFPPKISRAFGTLPNQIAAMNARSSTLGTEELERLVTIHPDSSLMNLLADIYLSGVAMPSTPLEVSIDNLTRAQELYLQATKTRGFLNDTQDFAWKGLFTTGVTFAFKFQHEVERNQELYSMAAEFVDPKGIPSKHCRVFTITLLTANRLELARSWGQAWFQAAESEQEQVDAMWHIAVTRERQQDWLAVLADARSILKINPDHEMAKGLAANAIHEIQLRLNVDDPDSVPPEDEPVESEPRASDSNSGGHSAS